MKKQTTLAKRAALKTVYKSAKWAKRVDKMSDEQVVAITLRLQLQSKL